MIDKIRTLWKRMWPQPSPAHHPLETTPETTPPETTPSEATPPSGHNCKWSKFSNCTDNPIWRCPAFCRQTFRDCEVDGEGDWADAICPNCKRYCVLIKNDK